MHHCVILTKILSDSTWFSLISLTRSCVENGLCEEPHHALGSLASVSFDASKLRGQKVIEVLGFEHLLGQGLPLNLAEFFTVKLLVALT